MAEHRGWGWFKNWKCIRCDRCANTDENDCCKDNVNWIILDKKEVVVSRDLLIKIKEMIIDFRELDPNLETGFELDHIIKEVEGLYRAE